MTDAFAAAYPARWSWRAKLLLPAVHPMTLVRAIHLGLMFPLGIASFVFLVVTLAVGGSLIWTLIGPIVLLLGLYISRWFGDLEAWRVRHVAGIELRRPPTGIERGQSFRQQVKTRLIDPSTWTGLIYLLIQFPIGIVAFVWLVVLGAVAGALMAAPLLVQFSEPSSGIQIMIDFGFWSTNLTKQGEIALALVPVGVLVYFVLVHSIYIGTAVHASWARLMLGSRAEPIALGPAERPEPPPPPTTGIDMPADEEAPVAALASGEESDPAAPALEDEVAAPEVPAAAPEIPAAPLEPTAPDPTAPTVPAATPEVTGAPEATPTIEQAPPIAATIAATLPPAASVAEDREAASPANAARTSVVSLRPTRISVNGGASAMVMAQTHPRVMAEPLANQLVPELDAPLLVATGEPLDSLTTREREVLTLIARGYSNAAIAETFVISEGTVKTHVKRVLAKLGLRDRTQAAIYAYETNFVAARVVVDVPEPIVLTRVR